MAEADIEAAAAAPSRSPASPTTMTLAEMRGILPGALRELLWEFAKYVVLCFVSAMWVNYCVFLASPLACVEGASVLEAFFVTGGLVFLGLFAFCSVAAVGLILSIGFFVLLLLLFRCRWVRNLEAAEIREDGGCKIPAAAQLPGPESAGASCRQKALFYAVALLLLMTIAVGLMPTPLPPTGYCGDGVCSISMPMDIRCFPNSIDVLLHHFFG